MLLMPLNRADLIVGREANNASESAALPADASTAEEQMMSRLLSKALSNVEVTLKDFALRILAEELCPEREGNTPTLLLRVSGATYSRHEQKRIPAHFLEEQKTSVDLSRNSAMESSVDASEDGSEHAGGDLVDILDGKRVQVFSVALFLMQNPVISPVSRGLNMTKGTRYSALRFWNVEGAYALLVRRQGA